MEDITFKLGPALVAGVVSSAGTTFLLFAMLAIAPTRFPLNPLYLVGSAFSIDTTPAYIWGFGVLLLAGAAYGVVVSAVFTGFQVDSFEFLWGAVTGGVLSVVSGTTLAYLRSLNRAVRAGQVGDPGLFLIRYGPWSVTQLVVAHVLFGTITGGMYATLS